MIWLEICFCQSSMLSYWHQDWMRKTYWVMVITYYRSREASFWKYFVRNDQLVYCKDIKGLLLEMSVTYVPGDWRLFIDSSKWTLKCVLLHNGNVYGSIPIGDSVELKGNHCCVKLVLDSLSGENPNWKNCVDLKMVNFLLGQQSG